MNRALTLGFTTLVVTSLAWALSSSDQVKINEIYFAGSVNGERSDGFIELYNAGSATAFLDGAMIAQGPDTFSQIAYTFPGEPGESNLPLAPGGFLVVAIDAYNFAAGDPSSVNLAFADFESYNTLELNPGDNPDVPNLVDRLDVGFDLFFEQGWGQVTLSTGEFWNLRPCEPGQACGSVVAEIALETVVDGLEYLRALSGDTLPILNDQIDAGYILGIAPYSGESAERILPGQDSDNSGADFRPLPHPTPGYQSTLDAGAPPRSHPVSFVLHSCYPNPFNSSTTIELEVSHSSPASLKLFDLLGREVVTLFTGSLPAGRHRFFWNGTDHGGATVSGGVYFLQLRGMDGTAVEKLIYAR